MLKLKTLSVPKKQPASCQHYHTNKLKFVGMFLLAVVVSLPFTTAALAYEDDTKAPTAFVEGTWDYTIKHFELMLAVFEKSKKVPSDLVSVFRHRIGLLKTENLTLQKRADSLRAQGSFLKENDPVLVSYRKNLNETTNLMFYLMRKLTKP